eukprot:CAMPEP_0118683862 /NCGR_PEP_ID=MMETSP0800-20121206/6298_1 /TAXON_ID=210618 ORGANISM="Striatella unipunctata, Strain CCMP2910" /NCGR_SAMPLE_ID=MMETSP0800 /ASSEMBLY_ACC=CAM_ASM_000638 /LENGTH=320 /DNA_ID=CAMNT_0006580453 /DNA_START=747 /DNA_END=1709 /DNA_ORIENTATION=+
MPREGVYIFTARLVLEVFGGGGAIWGFSEVVTFRNPETQEFWRTNAQVIAALFFVRFFLQILDFLCGKSRDEKTLLRFFAIFLAKIVLEVFGAGGAIWGFSESLTLRYAETQEFWRKWASFVAVIFFGRFLLQMRDFLREMRGLPSSIVGMDPWIRFYQIFAAKLVLEVFGGAGAIWGFSEVMTFRNPETQSFWRFVALVVGFCFYVRFLLQMKDYIIDVIYPGKSLILYRHQFVRLLQIFSAKLVLEVFGGAGAIWGFSESLTFRNPETQEFWRFNALTVGFIFSIRFVMQIKDYLLDAMDQNVKAAPVFTSQTTGLLV